MRQWLLGFFCEPPHGLYGLCTELSITFDRVSSQRLPIYSSATKFLVSQAYRYMVFKKGSCQLLAKVCARSTG